MLFRAVACSLALLICAPAWAQDGWVCPGWSQAAQENPSSGYSLYASPYTFHWSDENKAQHKPVFAFSLSRQLPNDRFCGFSLFRNSFGQPSAYAFTGWNWPQPFSSMPNVYATVSAGIIYGYVGEFKDKVPLNIGGFSPVIVPSIGYRVSPQLGLEVTILGTAAVMFGASWHF
jgi:hypothetical protein